MQRRMFVEAVLGNWPLVPVRCDEQSAFSREFKCAAAYQLVEEHVRCCRNAQLDGLPFEVRYAPWCRAFEAEAELARSPKITSQESETAMKREGLVSHFRMCRTESDHAQSTKIANYVHGIGPAFPEIAVKVSNAVNPSAYPATPRTQLGDAGKIRESFPN